MRDHHEVEGNGAAALKARRARFARELWWLGLTIAFALFVVTGRVSTYLGVKGRGNERVWEVWRRLPGDLPDVGSPALVRAGYVLMIVVFLSASLAALWFALEADGSDELPAPRDERRQSMRAQTSPLATPDTR